MRRQRDDDRAGCDDHADLHAEFSPTGGGSVIPGAEVCVVAPAGLGCVTGRADAAGVAAIPGLTAGEPAAVRITASGFVSSLFHSYVPAADTAISATVASDALAQTFADSVMITWPDLQNGVIVFNVFDTEGNGKSGVVLSISPASGEGPFYTSDAGLPDPMLTETVGSLGFFTGVAPGDYEVTIPGCEITGAWLGSKSDAAATVVEANTLSNISGTCP